MKVEEISEAVFEWIAKKYGTGKERRVDSHAFASGTKTFRICQMGKDVLFCEIPQHGYTSIGIWENISAEDIQEDMDWVELTDDPLLYVSNDWDLYADNSPQRGLMNYRFAKSFILGREITTIVLELLSHANDLAKEAT